MFHASPSRITSHALRIITPINGKPTFIN